MPVHVIHQPLNVHTFRVNQGSFNPHQPSNSKNMNPGTYHCQQLWTSANDHQPFSTMPSIHRGFAGPQGVDLPWQQKDHHQPPPKILRQEQIAETFWILLQGSYSPTLLTSWDQPFAAPWIYRVTPVSAIFNSKCASFTVCSGEMWTGLLSTKWTRTPLFPGKGKGAWKSGFLGRSSRNSSEVSKERWNHRWIINMPNNTKYVQWPLVDAHLVRKVTIKKGGLPGVHGISQHVSTGDCSLRGYHAVTEHELPLRQPAALYTKGKSSLLYCHHRNQHSGRSEWNTIYIGTCIDRTVHEPIWAFAAERSCWFERLISWLFPATHLTTFTMATICCNPLLLAIVGSWYSCAICHVVIVG